MYDLALRHFDPSDWPLFSRVSPTAVIFRDTSATNRHLDGLNAPGSRTISLSTGSFTFLEYRFYEYNVCALLSSSRTLLLTSLLQVRYFVPSGYVVIFPAETVTHSVHLHFLPNVTQTRVGLSLYYQQRLLTGLFRAPYT